MEPPFITPGSFKPFIAHNQQTDLDRNVTKNKQIMRLKCSQPILYDPDLPFSLEENVFLIDHIVETIFFALDKVSLLECRLVSWRWSYIAAKALQKLVTIKFYPSLKPFGIKQDPALFYFWRNVKQPIRDLVEVMNNSQEFPCSSFSFRIFRNKSTDKIIQPLHSLFMTHAARIKKLHIEGEISCKDLTQLVCVLALNVKELVIGELSIWSGEPQDEIALPAEFELDDSEEFIRKVTLLGTAWILNGRSAVWKNLTIFKSSDPIPNSLIHQILESSPNLVEVFVNQHNLQCLVKPTNRLHLVKRLNISFCCSDTESLELVANNHEDNLAVEQIEFYGCAGNDERLEKLVDIAEEILYGCSATCRKLVCHDTLKNFRIPRMLGINHLTFKYEVDYRTGLAVKLFPDKISLGDAFPNLQSILINSVHEMANVCVEDLFGHGDDKLSFRNVKQVTLQFRTFDESLQNSLGRMFPNANIRTYDIALGFCFEK